mgnify:CR=1 FL=1
MTISPEFQVPYKTTENIMRITGCDDSVAGQILEEVMQAQYFAASAAVCGAVGEFEELGTWHARIVAESSAWCEALGKFAERAGQLLQVARDDQERRIAGLSEPENRAVMLGARN